MFSSIPQRSFATILATILVATPWARSAGFTRVITAADQPSSAPVGKEKLQVTVTAVEGIAQYRIPPAAWKPCTVGLVLDEGAEFRTGLKSVIQFTMPVGQTVTLDRLGVVKVVDAVRNQGKATTNLGMPHGGRVRIDIEAAGGENRTAIRAPNSTLAVTGTDVIIYDQMPFPPEAVSLTGRAEFSTIKRRTQFGGKGAGKTQVAAGQSAAESMLSAATVDPSIRAARSPEEAALVANLLSQGSVFDFSNKGSIPVVHGGIPPTDSQLISVLPGKLDFVLRWTGNANLDLIVGTQAGSGEVMLPVTGANTTKSGGKIPFDHQGGANGGIEIGYWKDKFPTGIDTAFVNATSGQRVDFTLDVFQNKQRIPIMNSLGESVTTLAGTVSPGSNAIAAVTVGSTPPKGPPDNGPPPTGKITTKLTTLFPAVQPIPKPDPRALKTGKPRG